MISKEEPILKVSQVAKHLKISADRLRTYDEEKLILPVRENNVRLYSMLDVEWLDNLRKLIGKDKLTIFGFKEILKIIYFMPDELFEKYVSTTVKSEIWDILKNMKENPNFERLRKFYI